MNIVIVNKTDKDHLEYVTSEMRKLGTPTIKAIWIEAYGMWFAAEGSHRIVAAKNLGLVPVIEDVTGKTVTVQREEEDREMDAEELETWLTTGVERAIIVRF